MYRRLCQAILSLKLFIVFITHCHGVSAWETVYEAASIARCLVDFSQDSIATMATIFPSDHSRLAEQPFALQEYYAGCHSNGSLTLLFLPISQHSQNILHSSGNSASLSVSSKHPSASEARVSLIGNVTIFRDVDVPEKDSIQACYVAKHPDARRWVPDNDDAPHLAYWARFDPVGIYFVGGFGDEHYIGHIPLEIYQRAVQHALCGRVLLTQ